MGRGSLTGEVAIVTGASSGIGAATARELGCRGATVALAARRVDALEAGAERIRAAGGEAVAIQTDVSRESQLTRLVDQVVDSFGRVDILVNNAGIAWTRPLASTSQADVERVTDVNLLAAMLLTRAVVPGMVDRGHGAIITIGSLSGRVAMEPLYSATKYGLRGFSLALRRQLAGTGVSVSLVSPGNVRTPMTAHVKAHLPEPEVVADAVADLVARPRREVVVPGKHYAIAWLEQALPRLADFAYERRHWSPVIDEEGATWRS